MKRSLNVDRTYFLGDYRSLKISDYIQDIPEELSINPEFMGVMRTLQLLEIERAYYQYSVMSQQMKEAGTDGEKFLDLTEIVNNTFEKLLELYQKIIIKEN